MLYNKAINKYNEIQLNIAITMTSALASTNSNLSYFQWKINEKVGLHNSLKKELTPFDQFVEGVQKILTSSKSIKSHSVFILTEVLGLRMKAIPLLSSVDSYEDIINEITAQIEAVKSNKRLEFLIENILFAIRCNKRVFEGLLPLMDNSVSLVNTLSSTEDSERKVSEWLMSSLYVEFVMIAADVINENKKLEVTDEKITELAFLVADEAQNYFALAKELGFLKKRSQKESVADAESDHLFVQEQKELAEIGLDDFAKNFIP